MGRRLGQHFLNDPGILDRIVSALDPAPDDIVIEIGPGKGSLTARLAPRVGRVVAIEKDERLAGDCGLRIGDLGLKNIDILVGDALTIDWHALAVQSLIRNPQSPLAFKVVGNIPYQITSPLIEKALTPPLSAVIVMLVQKEVADRLTADPGGHDYGALTVGVRAVARVERIFVVKAGAFAPPPKVDSAVVRFLPLAEPLVSESERVPFRTFVAALFSHRRKQMIRNLREAVGLTRDRAAGVLAQLAIPESARVEVLAPAQIVAVFRKTRASHTL